MMRLSTLLLATTLIAGPALAQPASSTDIAAQTKTLHNDLYAATNAIVAQLKANAGSEAAKLDLLHNDIQALIVQLKAAPAGVGAVATTGSGPASDAAYFPASSGDALFPSPENSRMSRNADGTIGGRPYLLDQDGVQTRLVPVIPPTEADKAAGRQDAGIEIAGQRRTHYLGTTISGAIVRGKQVYVQLSGGQWQHFEPAMGSFYNAALPDVASAAGPGAATTTSASTTLPAPYAVAPGSSGRVLTAVPGQVASVLATAQDGDTLVLDGHYAETVPLIGVSLLVRLMPGTVVDFTDQELAQGKGGFVPARDFILEGPTVDKAAAIVTGAGIKETSAGGTACVRPAATSYITIRGNIDLTKCQNGVAGGGFPWVLDMVDTTLDGNGLGDGYTHNAYPADAIRVSLTRVTSRNPRGGHAFKARTAMFSAVGGSFSADETLIDLPNGTATVATLSGVTLTKNPGAANHRLIGYGEEGASKGAAGMVVTGGTVTGGDGSFIQGVGTVTFDGTAMVGTRPAGQGVKIVGP